ncbi:MAG: exopolysaccharide Pel transporter PelG [Rhodopseudomonas palustris]|nr:exopolysaccharide Pel transporter PelG [Rhodopseudomonas palustris]
MTTASVLRRYGRILASYGAGMALVAALAALLGPRYGAAGGVAALAAGYGLAALLLAASALAALGGSPLPRFGALMAGYLRRYRNLVLTGLAYAAGTWADKAILWAARGEAAGAQPSSSSRPTTAPSSTPTSASCPAWSTSPSATETDFHLGLRRFLVLLARGRRGEIEEARLGLARGTRRGLARALPLPGRRRRPRPPHRRPPGRRPRPRGVHLRPPRGGRPLPAHSSSPSSTCSSTSSCTGTRPSAPPLPRPQPRPLRRRHPRGPPAPGPEPPRRLRPRLGPRRLRRIPRPRPASTGSSTCAPRGRATASEARGN